MTAIKADTNKIKALIKEHPSETFDLEFFIIDNDCFILHASLIEYLQYSYKFCKARHLEIEILEKFGKVISGKEVEEKYKYTINIEEIYNEKCLLLDNIINMLRKWYVNPEVFPDKKNNLIYLGEIFLYIKEVYKSIE